ncbi:glycosyltransferase [Salipaludibacillus sp. HK11]|uniref:glycosyltransferase n=1 Tax=Salipaludibacillus sp. HK11 TaxID=3394320 RepID=UPI0039FC0AF8
MNYAMEKSALFTVIIPAFNCKKPFVRTLKSVLRQTYEHWQVFILNDALPDAMKRNLADKRISLITTKKNKSFSESMNTALSKINTPYFMQLDPYDWLEKNALSNLAKAIDHSPKDTALFYGNSKLSQIRKRKTTVLRNMKHDQYKNKYDFLKNGTSPFIPRCFKTEAVRAIKGWGINQTGEEKIVEDRFMCCKLIDKYRFQWVDQYLYNYHKPRNYVKKKNAIAQSNSRSEECIYHFLKKWSNVYSPIFTHDKDGYIKIERYKKVKKLPLHMKDLIRNRSERQKKIKILYSTVVQKNYIKENREYFKKELSKRDDVHVHYISDGGNIKDILAKLNFTPDFIYLDDVKKTKPITGLGDVNIPKGFLYTDLHGNHDVFRQLVKENKIDLIFSLYRDGFAKFHPNYMNKFVWLPHHVFTPVFKDYRLIKEIDYLLMGVLSQRTYPFRTKIAREMKGVKGFVRHRHPGYRFFTEKEKAKTFIGEKYAREINKAKMFFTDDSIYKYPIAKYYEVAACNTLLLGSGSKELKDLGFIDGDTFVEINERNFYQKARFYLKHEKLRNKITEQGYNMVRNNHTTAIRVEQFVDCIRRFIGKESKLRNDLTKQKWVKLNGESHTSL